MIETKHDLKRYLAADRAALGKDGSVRTWLADEVWRFQRRLRRYEYSLNRGSRVLGPIRYFRMQHLGNRLGFTVAPNVFGPGLCLVHPGTVAVNDHASVGARCRVSVNVVIGAALRDSSAAPTIGDDCFLGPGAVVLGDVVLGPHTIVGANSVVTRSYPEGNVTLVGTPAIPLVRERSSSTG